MNGASRPRALLPSASDVPLELNGAPSLPDPDGQHEVNSLMGVMLTCRLADEIAA
jgi:hypothetical protein